MRKPFPIFVGFDPREAVAYHVCCQSILEKASVPVAFTPLALSTLPYVEAHDDGSNAFIYSRFLVPYLMNFTGHALFVDGDMIVRRDVAELIGCVRTDVGVQVVKHDYRTKFPTKYLGSRNDDYPRKNWSSVMLWNCGFAPHRALSPAFVERASGAYLHRFQWLDDVCIGELPAGWNHLCMEYEPADAALYHFTVGTPCFEGFRDQEGAQEWHATLRRVLAPM